MKAQAPAGFREPGHGAPAAGKDVSEVVKVVLEARLTKKVALPKPLVVIKG
jgi:RNA-splicing ligase RtcB